MKYAFVMIKNPWTYRELIWQLTKRDVMTRYRGSVVGILWSFINPILMLTVYTFFFSVIYKSRLSLETNKVNFALILFSGLIPFTLFSECITRAPSLINNHINYVKKVIFPLEILPWISFGTAFFHACISLIVLLIFLLITQQTIHWTILFLPLVNLPLVCLILGLSWMLAAAGVFIRDIVHTISLFTMALLFLSPVFYSVGSIPTPYRQLILLNPLTTIIEQNRAIIIYGQLPNWHYLLINFFICAIIMWLGFKTFEKMRYTFADVL